MSQLPDVIILGSGVIGLTTAYYLGKAGARVRVLERFADLGREASWAGAGILPPGNPECARLPIDLLRAHSSALMPELSAELRERTKWDNGYLKCGGVELGCGDGDSGDEWRSDGVEVEALDARGVQALEPAVKPASRVSYYLPGMAQVRNPRHLRALTAACSSYDITFHAGCAAHEFECQGSRVTAVQTSMGRQAAGQYLIAAGAWSEELLAPLGWRPGIRPIRGQIVLLNTGTPLFRKIVLFGKHYLVPRDDGLVLIGSTEEDVGFEKRTTAAGVQGLLELGLRLVPRLAEAAVERSWSGLRPGSPDGLPFLGPVPGLDNLFVAAGHFRAGLQLSAATGLVMHQLLLGRPLTVPLESFRLDRQSAAPGRVAFRS